MTYTDPSTYVRFVHQRHLPPARDLVDMMELARGTRVLDVGCGTGVALAMLKEVVGEEGEVIGVDPAPAMLNYAAGIAGSSVVLGRAPRLPFLSATFDAAMLNFVLADLPDVGAGLADITRVLSEQTLIGVAAPGAMSSPQRDLWLGLADAWRVEHGLESDNGSDSKGLFGDPDTVAAALIRAGISIQASESRTYTSEFTCDEYADLRADLAPSRALAATLARATWAHHLDEAREAYRDRFGSTLLVPFQVSLVVGEVGVSTRTRARM